MNHAGIISRNRGSAGVNMKFLSHDMVTYTRKMDKAGVEDMIIGNSKLMQDLMSQVEKISNSNATVLLQGETGTGKSLLAKKIHEKSSRKDGPFITIDCGALSDSLFETELFGHVKGAFTNAVNGKKGLLEEAQGGTVFLDEISEIRLPTQVKILHVLQEKKLRQVGSNRQISIDVRFITATSIDLKKQVEKGLFREELFYRLAVIPLYLPALRERQRDLPLLIKYFLNKYSRSYSKSISHIEPDAFDTLCNFCWEGNIRELSNVIERAVLLTDKNRITMDCIASNQLPDNNLTQERELSVPALKQVINNAEKKAIIKALSITENNRSESARKLGISRRALYYKMKLYGLE